MSPFFLPKLANLYHKRRQVISHLFYFMLHTKFCYGPSLCFPKMWRKMRGCESFKTIWLRVLCFVFYHLSTITRKFSYSISFFFSFLSVAFFVSSMTKWLCDEIMLVYSLWALQNVHSILKLPFMFLVISQ
jgi:hypothetical protein